jgi:hypothetical protein
MLWLEDQAEVGLVEALSSFIPEVQQAQLGKATRVGTARLVKVPAAVDGKVVEPLVPSTILVTVASAVV